MRLTVVLADGRTTGFGFRYGRLYARESHQNGSEFESSMWTGQVCGAGCHRNNYMKKKA